MEPLSPATGGSVRARGRILTRYRQTTDILLMEGATPAAVDTALEQFGMAMGPYAVQDLSGLDIAYANRKRKNLKDKPGIRYIAIADRMVEDLKRLGRKTRLNEAQGQALCLAGPKRGLLHRRRADLAGDRSDHPRADRRQAQYRRFRQAVLRDERWRLWPAAVRTGRDRHQAERGCPL